MPSVANVLVISALLYKHYASHMATESLESSLVMESVAICMRILRCPIMGEWDTDR